ncbi:MAG: class I SAM-dependent methyltransferase [Patescibacteria group bacterium]|nr:class I SAM-dependent methyltransferase [Patescibacteria group bacterium]
MKKYIKGKIKLFKEIVFGRFGMQNDFVGYETLINFIEKNKLHGLEGDFLEIGAFMGGGSAKLARYVDKYSKKLIVIDLFDPNFDSTPNDRDERMNWIYKKILGKKNLRDIFNENTKNEKNIVVYSGDSKKVRLPENTKLCFTFIDGNHDPKYVKNDFYLALHKTIPGGVIAYHDYGGDLPQTTKAIQDMIDENKEKIIKTELVPEKSIIFITLR